MAITAGVQLIEFISVIGGPCCGGGLSEWANIGPSDHIYLTVADDRDANDNITDPANEIHHSSRQIFGRFFSPASFVAIRMMYDLDPVSVNPIVKLFGCVRFPNGTAGPWRIMKNRVGDASVTIVTDPQDIRFSDYRVTTPDAGAHVFDLHGCNEFLLGVQRAVGSPAGGLQVLFG